MFVEIKCSGHIEWRSTRRYAAEQLREQIVKLFDDIEIEKLYGLSATGAGLCI